MKENDSKETRHFLYLPEFDTSLCYQSFHHTGFACCAEEFNLCCSLSVAVDSFDTARIELT